MIMESTSWDELKRGLLREIVTAFPKKMGFEISESDKPPSIRINKKRPKEGLLSAADVEFHKKAKLITIGALLSDMKDGEPVGPLVGDLISFISTEMFVEGEEVRDKDEVKEIITDLKRAMAISASWRRERLERE